MTPDWSLRHPRMKGSKASRTITFSSRVPTQRGVSRVLFVPKVRWNLAGGASHRATPASENRPGRGGGTNPPAAHERSSAAPAGAGDNGELMTGGWRRRLISVVLPADRQSSHTRSVTLDRYFPKGEEDSATAGPVEGRPTRQDV